MKDIIVAKISLHYEARPTIIQILSRERYARKLQEQKSGKDYHNYYFKRITEKERDRIMHEQEREIWNKTYDKLIREKYSVGKGWEKNRWFVEQVRPTT